MVDCNIPFAVADQLSPRFKEKFPDSKIAAGYASKKTKTTCIVNGALKPHFRSQLVSHMKSKPFSLAIDGSNDSGLLKMNPLTVRIFSVEGISTQLLDMCMTRGGTAENLFGKMDETLQRFAISWSKCISVGVDNTSVNLGKRKSIMTKVKEKNVGDFCVDIYYWFDKSTKRKQALQDFCIFCDTEYAAMVKHVSTRWLSLESAISRILLKYALKSYFLSNEDRSPRFVRLAKQFEDPFTEVHLLFHLSVLQLFVRVNKVMQLESPLIPFLDGLLHDFLAKFCCRFLNVRKVKEAGPVHVDPEDDAVKMSNDKLDIGFTAKALVKNLVDGGCDMREVSKFYAAVCAFYKQGLLYARSRLLQIQC